MIRRSLLLTGTALILASCEVGPDFHLPKLLGGAGYTPEAQPAATAATDVAGGVAQRFVAGKDIPGQWWTLFHSEALNKLIDEALKANPTLEAAQATLREAHENTAAERGVFIPGISGSYSTTREKISGAEFGNPKSSELFTLSTGSLNISYGLDFFGAERRQLESTRALEDYQRYELEASYLTITSNVVAAAIQEASLRDQIAATQDIIKAQQQELDLLQKQFALGGVAKAAVLAQEATLDATEATLPNLQKQLAQQEITLTVLVGRYPSQQVSETFDLADLRLPEDLPFTLPSQLVEQRPDIQAAQAQLHSASAQIGVAIGNMLPQITINGGYGNSVLDITQLLSGPGIWSLGAGIATPVFRGAQLFHQKEAAVAAFDASAAQYRSTVLTAFQNVAETLRALQTDADALKAQVEAENSSAANLKISEDQFRLGAINYTTLLNAQTTYQQAHVNRVVAQANRYADTAALFQALGGGWWNRSDVASNESGASPKQQ